MAMTEDEVLELWERISGYSSDWDSVITDLLDEIDSMLSQATTVKEEEEYASEDTTPDLQHLRDTLLDLRKLIYNETSAAMSGDIVQTELEEFFVKASRTLRDVESKVFELRELTPEFDDVYEFEEAKWEEEEEEEE